VNAVANALRTEYETIVGQGPVLQIDGPDLAMERHRLFADRPLAEFLDFLDLTIAAIGNYEGPHNFDVPLDDLLPHLYEARVGGLVRSMANPS
jgi:5-methyltetrahydropteroyltriglutamate--homocysteine methyltransferase